MEEEDEMQKLEREEQELLRELDSFNHVVI